MSADEITQLMPVTAANLQPPNAGAFETHNLELGKVNPSSAFGFNDEEPSQLFASPPAEANPSEADWEHLWQNASRIPITAIPEPSVGALLIGSAMLCVRRMRNKGK